MRKATRERGSLMLLVWLFLPCLAHAQAPVAGAAYQVKDIKTTLAVENGSGTYYSLAMGDVVYFDAWRKTTGTELWKTDGTAEGTVLVKDILPGPGSSSPEILASLDGTVLFVADDGGTGRELWKSDGTAAGTVLVKDVRPGTAGSEPWMPVAAGGSMYFLADDGVHGRELWKTDGTAAGTVLVKDIRPGIAAGAIRLYAGPAGVYLAADDGIQGLELWRSDGTEGGTVLVKDIAAGAAGSRFSIYTRPTAAIGGTFFFVVDDGANGYELWRSDGTESGTLLVKDISTSPFAAGPMDLWTAGSRVVFGYSIMGSVSLWASDGTEAGTVDLGASAAGTIGAAGPYVYFQAYDPTHDVELWRTDGTVAGTVLVKDIYPDLAAGSYPNTGASLGSTLYFLATTNGSSWTLFKTDGTEAGTLELKALNGFQAAVGASTWLFFSSQDEAGQEPWRSDGTPAGTTRLKNVHPATSDPEIAEPVAGPGGLLIFRATDEASGGELWRSDGTESGTVSLDLQAGPDGSFPSSLEAVGPAIYFRAYDPVHDNELWRSDGTAAGTAMVKDVAPGVDAGSDLRFTRNLAGTLLFSAKSGDDVGQELWRSDGTEAGTVMLGDQRPGPGDLDPKFVTAATGRLYFMGYQDGYGRELWSSDGTEAGTAMVKDLNPGSDGTELTWLAAVGGAAFFDAPEPGSGGGGFRHPTRKSAGGGALARELWRSDGTEAGTAVVKDIGPGSAGSFPSFPTAVGGTLFFSADDGTHGAELWKSDGTAVGTLLVKDIFPGLGGSAPVRQGPGDVEDSQEKPSPYAALGDVLLFAANDGVHGLELWRSDGTEAGTVLVKDIAPGASGSNPDRLMVHGGALYFTASDGETGYELWRSDGTAAGTALVGDVTPGAESSSPVWLTSTGSQLYFVADDGESGHELWAVANSADLSITKTDGVGSVLSGWSVTYTITVANAGPGTVLGARVSDVLPAALQGASWTCTPSGETATCTATGSGDIDDTVNLGAGESLAYTLEATASGSGALLNTATVSVPGDFVDPDPSNNSATDTDSIVPIPNNLVISDVERVEGNSGTATATLTVTLSPASATTVTVSWATAGGTATTGTDFVAATGSLTFLPGETTKTIGVSVRGDSQVEGDETFTVDLSGASGAEIWDDQGQVTILNDDSATQALPFGYVDTPLNGAAGVTGAIAVTGWALDDTGVLRVVLSRDPVAPEPAGSRVYIGDAIFIAGARPDVAAAFPAYPFATRAGWGYMLLTNMLPNHGNGTFRLWLHAIDREGHEVLLGTRTITCSNAAATRPFGTIDTPAQGATVGGNAYVVFGWVLTPQPGAIPADGSTIWVFVDGVPVGHPVYGQYRSDIATLFPGYANSDGAVGYYVLDTTQLANGIHTIAWSVTDDLGRADGIGSRYFWVSNTSGDKN